MHNTLLVDQLLVTVHDYVIMNYRDKINERVL